MNDIVAVDVKADHFIVKIVVVKIDKNEINALWIY